MKPTILIIDDDEAIRKAFTLTLEDYGYAITTAESGETGIEILKQNSCDLIFLDLKMPGMNGVDTLCEIRKDHRETPVYIITAFHEEFLDQLSICVESGIEFELLRKPVGSAQLIAVTRGILEEPVTY